MPNKVVIFPAGKETQAQAYRIWTDTHWPGAPDLFAYIRNDAYGQWVVPYLGPPFEMSGDIVAEPTGGLEARADGVLADTWTTPPEPEETE